MDSVFHNCIRPLAILAHSLSLTIAHHPSPAPRPSRSQQAYTDIVIILFLLLSYLWMRMFEGSEARTLKHNNITADDYSVRISGIPPDVTEDIIKEHFEAQIRAQMAADNERMRPGQVKYDLTEKVVNSVFLAHNNSKLIELYKQRGKMMFQLEKAHGAVFALRHRKKKGEAVSDRKLSAAITRHETILKKVETINEKRTKLNIRGGDTVVGCYITFETEHAYLLVRKRYPQGWLFKLCQSKSRRLKSLTNVTPHRVVVKSAPPPSTVLWENLEYVDRPFLKYLQDVNGLLEGG